MTGAEPGTIGSHVHLLDTESSIGLTGCPSKAYVLTGIRVRYGKSDVLRCLMEGREKYRARRADQVLAVEISLIARANQGQPMRPRLVHI